jgi:hypothetical protein
MQTKKFSIFLFTTLSVMLVALTGLHGQNRIGIRGGLNVSNISYDKLPNKSERFGYHLGVFADLPVISDFMSIQPELSYSVKGTAYDFLNERRILSMDYVDLFLPVAFKLSSIDIQVGPYASFLISTPDYTYFEDNSILIDAFKKHDVGLTAGLSYNFRNFLIGIRYNQGFVDITKDDARLLLGSGKNAVGQVSAGFKF